MGEEREILSYRGPDDKPSGPLINPWVAGAFLATAVILPLTVLLAGIEISGMLAAGCALAAGYALARSRNSNDRIVTAMTLLMCALAPAARTAFDRAGSSGAYIACASNLRSIGQGCQILEGNGTTSYDLNDVWTVLGTPGLSCPMHPGQPAATYVLLPHLQPYSKKLADNASVVVGYCLDVHSTQKRGDGGKRLMNVLYGDGHVESHDVPSAQKLIRKSLGATTQPVAK